MHAPYMLSIESLFSPAMSNSETSGGYDGDIWVVMGAKLISIIMTANYEVV